jgi:hypothetical protein
MQEKRGTGPTVMARDMPLIPARCKMSMAHR